LDSEVTTAKKTLRSYAATYLREEVQAESLTRHLEGFSRFFDLIAARAGDFIDFTKISSQAGIERMSARRYFEVLVDTLILQPVEAFTKSSRRRLVQHPKFYFFDVGVLNGALSNFEASADRRGNLFEHLCLQMILSEAKARDEDVRVSIYRTEGGAEVDFVLEKGRDLFAIEVKATRNVGSHDLRGLKSFGAFTSKRTTSIVLYLGENEQEIDGIRILPLRSGIAAIFG
jgi:predicted AAA+ superfamily ATPase